MLRSGRKLSYILLSILVAGVTAFTFAFAPVAIARDGGGGHGGGGHGGHGGGAGGGPGGGGHGGGGGGSHTGGGSPRVGGPGGGFHGPSRGSMPSRPAGPSMRSGSATGPHGFSHPGSPRGFGNSMRGGRGMSANPQSQVPPRVAPNMGAPTSGGRSVNRPQGGRSGQFGSVPSGRGNPANRSGAGRNMGQLGVPGGNFTPRTPGQYRAGRPGSVRNPSAVGQPGRSAGTPRRAPGITPGQGNRGGQGPRGNPNAAGQRGRGRGPGGQGAGPGQARQQWNQDWNRSHGNWNHNGDWHHNNNWNWNHSTFSLGFFFYPGFASAFDYGYWGFRDCGAYCSYSPFYYYGLPYVYAPRVVVTDVPVYTYTPVPDYSYGNGYYLSQGSYSGLDAAIGDIRNGWISGSPDMILRHIDTGAQIAVYLDNNYAYSLSGTDYRSMVSDAIGHIRTVSFNITGVEQRSDGAYTVIGRHEFYDVNNNHRAVDVSYTLAQQGGNWVIVAAGSSGAQ